jgi:hypothetical protein
MRRESIVDDIDNALLRLAVCVGDKVDDLFVFNTKPGACESHEDGPCLLGCVNGDRDEDVEGNIPVIK